MEAAADLLRLGGFARKCTVLFKGMEIELKNETLSLTALTHIPFFRAPTETYDLGGKLSVYNRRDMRKGQFSGYIKARADGGINFFYRWGEPFSGHCCDEIVLEDGGNSLIITTTLTLENGESCVYRVVYRRANAPATPPSSHLLKRIEMMKNSTHPHPHFHTPHHSPHHSPHLQINTHRPPPHHGHSHLHAQPQKRDSSQSVVSQHGSQSFRRKGTPDLSDSCPSERNETTVPARQRVSEDSERGRSPQRNALTATSHDAASPFYPAAATPSGSRLSGQATRSSMDSASDAIHSSNGSTRGRRDKSIRGQRKAGDDLRRSFVTFSEFMKL